MFKKILNYIFLVITFPLAILLGVYLCFSLIMTNILIKPFALCYSNVRKDNNWFTRYVYKVMTLLDELLSFIIK